MTLVAFATELDARNWGAGIIVIHADTVEILVVRDNDIAVSDFNIQQIIVLVNEILSVDDILLTDIGP